MATDVGRVIVSRSGEETVGDRRRRALTRAAGALPDVWPPRAHTLAEALVHPARAGQDCEA